MFIFYMKSNSNKTIMEKNRFSIDFGLFNILEKEMHPSVLFRS